MGSATTTTADPGDWAITSSSLSEAPSSGKFQKRSGATRDPIMCLGSYEGPNAIHIEATYIDTDADPLWMK